MIYLFNIDPVDVGQLAVELVAAGIPLDPDGGVRGVITPPGVRLKTTRDLTALENTTTIPAVLAAHVPWGEAGQRRSSASSLMDNTSESPLLVLLKALVLTVVDENNLLRKRQRDQDAAVAAATSLADFKVRWANAALANPMPDRTGVQARAALKNHVDDGTGDK